MPEERRNEHRDERREETNNKAVLWPLILVGGMLGSLLIGYLCGRDCTKGTGCGGDCGKTKPDSVLVVKKDPSINVEGDAIFITGDDNDATMIKGNNNNSANRSSGNQNSGCSHGWIKKDSGKVVKDDDKKDNDKKDDDKKQEPEPAPEPCDCEGGIRVTGHFSGTVSVSDGHKTEQSSSNWVYVKDISR